MESGLPSFPSGSTCLMVLGYLLHSTHRAFGLQDYHLLWWAAPDPSTIRAHETSLQHEAPKRPHNLLAATRVGFDTARIWALARSLAATRAISVDFSSTGTEMFHFTVCCLRHLCIQRRIVPDEWHGVAPFGHLRINACLRLPEAYRSLPRPSSPVETEASTVQLLVA